MKKLLLLLGILSAVFILSFGLKVYPAGEPIVIGVPTSTGFLEGKECIKTVTMAVDEINAKGGVNVGGVKKQLKVETLDIRDAAPGVPVSEALLGIEKIILEKKPTALVVGPFRSEALVASMDIIAKYKIPMLGTIAMTPATEGKIKENPEKYKYVFRTCLNAKYLVKYLAGIMSQLNKEFGFNKVYIMTQDVAWARVTADILTKVYFNKAKWTITGREAYPTGSSDFSSAMMKARSNGAQVILPIFDMPQSGILVKQWNTMKVPAVLAGFISPLAGPAAWKTFNKKIGGAMNLIFEMGSAISSKKMPESSSFTRAYKKRWGKDLEAGHGPAPSYESVYILKEAIERAGSLDSDAIVAALEKTDRKGIMGRIKFDDGHQVLYDMDPKESAVAVAYQWTSNGKRVIVFPPSLAEGKIKLPKGLKAAK